MVRVREFDTEAAIEAAMTAFRSKGYEGTSVQDLVDATGVGRGSLYAAFGSKEGLYLAAMDCYRDRYTLPLVEALGSGRPARELIREILVDLVDAIVQDATRQACLIVSAATERAVHDPKVARRVRSMTGSLEDALAELIAEAQANGQVPGARSARDLARFFVATIQGLRVMGSINPDRESLMTAAEVALGALE